MLSVLLTVLKIIGLVLLALLCILLALFLLILFVPIKYKAVGEYKDKKPDILLNVSYLLHIVSVSFTFKDKKPEFYVKIFGFRLKKKKVNQNKSKNNKEISNSEQTNKEVISKKEVNLLKEDNSQKEVILSKKDISEKVDSSDEDTSVKEDNIAKEDISSENNTTAENNETKKISFKDKLSNTKKDAEFYINLIKSDYFKNTFAVIRHRVGKILKSILPKRGKINLWLGFENAGTTGEIVGIYKALYAYIGHVVKLNSYYDRECTDVDFNIKGRIYIFILAFHGLCILLNKNVLKILRILKKRKK